MATSVATPKAVPYESQSGLDPWAVGDLPVPPIEQGHSIFSIIGPGAIVLGVSLGSGEWLMGPAAFVKYSMSLLWVTAVAVTLQTIFNTEIIRYVIYTGEPIFTAFMRTKPRSTFWAWFYAVLYFLQVGWPGWAGAAAGAIFFLFVGKMAGAADATAVYLIGVGTFLGCVLILMFGSRIERTLEFLNWILVIGILGGMLIIAIIFAPLKNWAGALVGFAGFDLFAGKFIFLPPGADFFLIGAFAAYSGAGGVSNLVLGNWARDKGFGMGAVTGFIPAAVGGQKVKLAHTGTTFSLTKENLSKFERWWKAGTADQWFVFMIGGFMGMALPAMVYTAFIPAGADIRGLAVASALANAMAERGGAVLSFIIAFMGAWILFKTQLDILEGMVRALTDILWTGNARVRGTGDVRKVYYAILGIAVVWGIIALKLAQPIILLQLGANMAGLILAVTGIHILWVNTHLLPKEIQPPTWRRWGLVAISVFYGFFVWMWLMGGVVPNPATGFLFNIPKYMGF